MLLDFDNVSQEDGFAVLFLSDISVFLAVVGLVLVEGVWLGGVAL
jgi:hypothetical protein